MSSFKHLTPWDQLTALEYRGLVHNCSVCEISDPDLGMVTEAVAASIGQALGFKRRGIVTLFGTFQKNLSAIDFSLLLPDVMTNRG